MNEPVSVSLAFSYSRIRTDFSRNPLSLSERERERITPLLNRRFSKSSVLREDSQTRYGVSYNPIFPSGNARVERVGRRTKERRDTRNEKSNMRRIMFGSAALRGSRPTMNPPTADRARGGGKGGEMIRRTHRAS